jgi:single-strand DNA-binding protein
VNDTFVTVVGNVVDSPRRASLPTGNVTNFRMASTARHYSSDKGDFVDGTTLWLDVECWNSLSNNVSASISKGDPVIVQGTLYTRSWESDNGRRQAPRLKASSVGPNLAKGRAVFTRDRAQAAPEASPIEPLDGTPAPRDAEYREQSEESRAGLYYETDPQTLDEETNDLLSEPAHA